MAHKALRKTDHRPWPIPDRPWRWRQTWCDLLFAHWPIEKELLRPLVPEPLKIQEFNGTSWVGVVPFRMEGVMLRYLPDLPWVSAFPELNLRLYVEYEGKPGIWFLSLDASNWLASWAARTFFNLPYHTAKMRMEHRDGRFEFFSKRKEQEYPVEFKAVYAPDSDIYEAEAGSLAHWLTERYCLYAQSKDGSINRTEVHHKPWPLQKAEADISTNELADPHGIRLDGPPELLHFSPRIEVVVWPPETVFG